MKPYVRVTALVLGALFLMAAVAAAVELWRDGDLLANPKLKPAAAWLLSGAMFLTLGLRGLSLRRKKPSEHNHPGFRV